MDCFVAFRCRASAFGRVAGMDGGLLGTGRQGRVDGRVLDRAARRLDDGQQPNGERRDASVFRTYADRGGPLGRLVILRNAKRSGRWLFAKDKQTATEIVFVNAKHDYPQRISYWREGKYLMAETSLSDGNKAQRWRYSPKR